MVASLSARAQAIQTFAQEIRRLNVANNRMTNVVAGDCVRQTDSALYHLNKASAAVAASSNAVDLPYWLAAARRQMSNCLDGFQEFAPSALNTPSGVMLNSLIHRTASTYDAAVALATNGAQAAMTHVARGRQTLEHVDDTPESDGRPTWIEAGLYEQIKELQAHLAGDAAGAQTWAERGRRALERSETEKLTENPRRQLQSSTSKAASKLKPDAVVGSGGKYKKIKDALKAAPSKGRFVILIKAGTYKEKLSIDKEGVILIGEGSDKTIITGKDSVAGGSSTYGSATVTANKDGFMAVGIRIENAAGPQGDQAVALMVSGDRSAIYDCAITGYQDTLCTDAGRQYYKNCYISGYTDFIFGDAAALIDSATIYLRAGKKKVQITASGRESKTPTGIVIRWSQVQSESGVRLAYLGRPWKDCARVVYVETNLPKEIQPDGWSTWNGGKPGSCHYYAEKGSTGPGAASKRVSWAKPGIISDAKQFGPQAFLELSKWLNVVDGILK
ncbi:hypothetical protein CLOM_g4771 [Closterium sp. NIES-68]|nr:hypothetical protein CLOM_g4771 [Closterium sp. NIES-68]GJP81227.1 hypothetical protein CLOP_g11392 [Closterium sp. NIES-67]